MAGGRLLLQDVWGGIQKTEVHQRSRAKSIYSEGACLRITPDRREPVFFLFEPERALEYVYTWVARRTREEQTKVGGYNHAARFGKNGENAQ